jgi:hypothetical protein
VDSKMLVFLDELYIILAYPVVESLHILLISFSFYFQVDQHGQICSCCLLDDISSTDRHKKMKTEVFIHQNQRVSFVDAYSDVNGWRAVSDKSICKTCTNLLESAYVFRQMCRVAADQPNYNVCRCCCQEKLGSNDQFMNMRNAVFEHNNKSVTYFEGYFDVNSLEDSATFTNSKVSICEDCAVQLESAYAFRRMCQNTTEILKQTFELEENKESGQDFSRFNLYHWKSHNTNKKKADTQRAAIKTDQPNLKLRHSHDIQQISFSFKCEKSPKTFKSKKLQYICKKCPKAFQTQNSLANHVRREHLNISYDCKDCDKVFNTPTGLYQHKLGHSKSYQCEKCPKAFRRRTILLQHIQTKHDNLGLSCQDCDKAFKSYSGLHKHKTKIHLKKLFKCKVCDKIYKNPTCLSAHTNAKHLNKSFQCEKCSKVYHQRDKFIFHYRIKHLNILLACQDCEKVFTSRGGLAFHKATSHLKILHQCEQCPKTFSGKQKLREHVEKIHEKKQYFCQDCNKVFKSLNGLSAHKNFIHLKKLLKCKNCEKTFTNFYTRNSHMKQEHLKLSFECQQCKKKLANKKTLALHIQKFHPNDPCAC